MEYCNSYSEPLRSELFHYGVKGQKRGLRRYQNEDGSLTSEGRDHYGVGDPRGPARGMSPASTSNSSDHGYRVRKYGKSSAQTLERKPQKLSKKEAAIRKTRAKRLLGAAAAVGAAAAIGYGMHRYNKTTNNLIQLAKNKVHEDYKRGESSIKTSQDKINHDYHRMRDISAIQSRYSAKKVLGLKGSKATRTFIKENNLAKRKTSEIMEQRTGKIVEGYRRSRITRKMKPYSERERRRIAEKYARNMRLI